MCDRAANPQSLQITQELGKRERQQYPLLLQLKIPTTTLMELKASRGESDVLSHTEMAKLKYHSHKQMLIVVVLIDERTAQANCTEVFPTCSFTALRISNPVLPYCLYFLVWRGKSRYGLRAGPPTAVKAQAHLQRSGEPTPLWVLVGQEGVK